MIDPKLQWANQIDVTNFCNRKCSNCTRLLSHVEEPFYMTTEVFQQACEALKDFPTESPKSPYVSVEYKVVGILGGEPLFHPKFEELCLIMEGTIPRKENRGLWTGLKWQVTKHAETIKRVFGYVNNNQHNMDCEHSPILISISDVIADEAERRAMISNCWLQRLWSATITPKGYFFCEVAGAMDMIFNGPGGLPIEPGCWKRPLSDFSSQISRWCNRCGIPLNLKGRRDLENTDDISISNLLALGDSPRVKSGSYELYQIGNIPQDPKPWIYLR